MEVPYKDLTLRWLMNKKKVSSKTFPKKTEAVMTEPSSDLSPFGFLSSPETPSTHSSPLPTGMTEDVGGMAMAAAAASGSDGDGGSDHIPIEDLEEVIAQRASQNERYRDAERKYERQEVPSRRRTSRICST